MSHDDGEGPTLPEEARQRFQKAAKDPKHQPTGKDDPRLRATREDPIEEAPTEKETP